MVLDDKSARRAAKYMRSWLRTHAADLCEADVDDAVQESLVKMMERPERDTALSARAVGSVRNRRPSIRKRESIHEELGDVCAPSYLFTRPRLDLLTTQQRRVCQMLLSGYSVSEAADALCVSVDAVTKCLRRARARLI